MGARMNTPANRQHVLLVGIDAYPDLDALQGCVNDVDALESLFLDRLNVEPSAIRKLVAPHLSFGRKTRLPEDKPTFNNIVRALEFLGSSAVCPDDRVFIYYSGHGTQVFSRVARTAHEALVPVDAYTDGDLLFDYEINELLERIAQRTKDVTVVFDACCSAGATRSAFESNHNRIRYCRPPRESAPHKTPSPRGQTTSRGSMMPMDLSDPGYLFVAAAQSCEPAHESRNAHGVCHGALTTAWLDLLAQTSDAQLSTLRWADLWPNLRARVTTAFPGQHPCLVGRTERRVLGGAFEHRDAGLALVERQDVYEIQGGSLVGLSVGAQVAVYGSEPAFFPTLHSREDLAARRGLLQVESVTLHSAQARAMGRKPTLEPGARGRLAKPGCQEKLVVGMAVFDAHVARYLESETPCTVVPLAEPGARVIESVIGLSEDGSWWLGDDVFGADAPLVRIPRGDLAALARVIAHDLQYRLPLRLARQYTSATEWIRLRVLDAVHAARMERGDLADPALPEVDADEEGIGRYRLRSGHPVCFSVENRFSRPLYAHLLNCASSGKVEILGPTQLEIPALRRQTFWRGGHLGRPFLCGISKGRTENVDRLIVVATTEADVDLRPLAQRNSFADVLTMSQRDVSMQDKLPAMTTATLVKVRIGTA